MIVSHSPTVNARRFLFKKNLQFCSIRNKTQIMKKNLEFHSTLEMTKQDWLNFRHRGVGGSDAGAVLGLNKYTSSIELFYQKLFAPVDKRENEAMHWGKALEDLIADRWQYWDIEKNDPAVMIENFNAQRIVRRCRRINAYIVNPQYPWLFASLDRIINKNGTETETALECKTIAGYVVDQWENGIPPSYVIQLQQYLLIPELPNGEIAMLKDGRFMEVLPFAKNEQICNSIVEKTKVFWQRVTNARAELAKGGFQYYTDDLPNEYKQAVAMHEPEPDGSEAYEQFLKARWRGESPERAGTEFEYQLGLEYIKLSESIKRLEEQQREFGNKLKASIGDAQAITFGKGGNITWRPNKNGVRAFKCGVKPLQEPQSQPIN